jgi:uncharacterized protein (UPF0210 family)
MDQSGENLQRWFLAARQLGVLEQYWYNCDIKAKFSLEKINEINKSILNLKLRSKRITIPPMEAIDQYIDDLFQILDEIDQAEKQLKVENFCLVFIKRIRGQLKSATKK